MVNIYDDLAQLNIPVYAEGAAPQNLPNEYFTVTEEYTSDLVNADNQTQQVLYEFTLKWYTKDATRLYTVLQEAIALLKSKNYIVGGVGYWNRTYKETWFSRQVDIEKIDYL